MTMTPSTPSAPVWMMRGAGLPRAWRGTSTRTYGVHPAAVFVLDLLFRHKLEVHLFGLLLMAWGFLQYRLCGAYLMKQGEGSGFGSFSFGFSQRRQEPNRNPAKLTTTGPYALTRNPMYMGHAIFTLGLFLATRSPFALLVCIYHAWYLHQRALQDEQALSERFGDEYAAYRERTPLWLPGIPLGR